MPKPKTTNHRPGCNCIACREQRAPKPPAPDQPAENQPAPAAPPAQKKK